ncbi:hypothetical protein ACFE04_022725 [Oxalis oulophora]
MAKPNTTTTTTTKLFTLSSLLMSIMFAYSASVQLNDPDWYLWFPLYSCACIVNTFNSKNSGNDMVLRVCQANSWLGILLFIKVVLEDFVKGISGFWSLDLSERVVREKVGSGLVFVSMVLHLIASTRRSDRRLVEYGMLMLAGFGYGLPFLFFVFQDGEMKF